MAVEDRAAVHVHHGAARCLLSLYDRAAEGSSPWSDFDAEAERVNADERLAREIERDALRNALESLRDARSSIAGNPHLTGEQRRRALAGLEQGLREIQRDIDRVR